MKKMSMPPSASNASRPHTPSRSGERMRRPRGLSEAAPLAVDPGGSESVTAPGAAD
jgi:hypothetical protein